MPEGWNASTSGARDRNQASYRSPITTSLRPMRVSAFAATSSLRKNRIRFRASPGSLGKTFAGHLLAGHEFGTSPGNGVFSEFCRVMSRAYGIGASNYTWSKGLDGINRLVDAYG